MNLPTFGLFHFHPICAFLNNFRYQILVQLIQKMETIQKDH